MADWAHKWTDKQLEELEKRFQSVYAQAEKEISAKLKKHLKAFSVKDAAKKKLVEDGKMTQEAYIKWRKMQVLTGKRWQELRDNMAADYVHADEIAMSALNRYLPEVYAENYNWSTYEIEKGINAGTSFTLYDRQTVERIMRDDPDLLKPISPDKAKDMIWNKRQLNSVITQGILHGESIPKIAKRVEGIGERNKAAAVRNARTAITSAQNAGRVDSYKRAENMGIELKQEWIATLDGRTRHTHRLMDGKRVKVGAEFPNGCKYPGDPDGPASEIYNCRCTLIAAIDGFAHNASDLSLRYGKNLEGMSYEEWKEGNSKSKKIPAKQNSTIKNKNEEKRQTTDVNKNVNKPINQQTEKQNAKPQDQTNATATRQKLYTHAELQKMTRAQLMKIAEPLYVKSGIWSGITEEEYKRRFYSLYSTTPQLRKLIYKLQRK